MYKKGKQWLTAILLIAGGLLLANGTVYADEVGTKLTTAPVADPQLVGINNVVAQQTNTGSNNTATQQTSVNNSNAAVQQTPSVNHKVGKNDPVNNVAYYGPDQNASKRQNLQKQLDENDEEWAQTSIKFNQLRSQFRQLDRKYKEYDQQYTKLEQQRKSILQQYNTIQQEINLLTGENNYDKRVALDKEVEKCDELYSKYSKEFASVDDEIERLRKINKNDKRISALVKKLNELCNTASLYEERSRQLRKEEYEYIPDYNSPEYKKKLLNYKQNHKK